MLRRCLLAGIVLVLAACSNCDSPCTSGVTFYVTPLAGALAPGSSQEVTFCVDNRCTTTEVTRDLAGGTVWVPYSGLDANGSHTVTVKGTGDSSIAGTYTGEIPTVQSSGKGGSCASCRVGAVQVGADGTVDVGSVPATVAPTTTGG